MLVAERPPSCCVPGCAKVSIEKKTSPKALGKGLLLPRDPKDIQESLARVPQSPDKQSCELVLALSQCCSLSGSLCHVTLRF